MPSTFFRTVHTEQDSICCGDCDVVQKVRAFLPTVPFKFFSRSSDRTTHEYFGTGDKADTMRQGGALPFYELSII